MERRSIRQEASTTDGVVHGVDGVLDPVDRTVDREDRRAHP